MPLHPKLPVRVAVSQTALKEMTREQLREFKKTAPPEKCYPAIVDGHALRYVLVDQGTSIAQLKRAREALSADSPAQPTRFDETIRNARIAESRSHTRKNRSFWGSVMTTTMGVAFIGTDKKPGLNTGEHIGFTFLAVSAVLAVVACRDYQDFWKNKRALIRSEDKKRQYLGDMKSKINELLRDHDIYCEQNPFHKEIDLDPNPS